jgi:DNA polymerase III epsilon subunit-like protein
VGDAPLVAHNAGFDIAFLNVELKRASRAPIATERVVDSLVLERRKHSSGLTLDDLCGRYGVDRSLRTQHGALLDAELLAAVYVELTTTVGLPSTGADKNLGAIKRRSRLGWRRLPLLGRRSARGGRSGRRCARAAVAARQQSGGSSPNARKPSA